MTHTTDDQIQAMRQLCEQLQAEPIIKSAYVDDWGRYGNFQLMVTPIDLDDRFFTNRLQALLRRKLPTGARLRQVFAPARERGRFDTCLTPRREQLSRPYWTVDVDYHAYDASNNTFEGFGRLAA